MVSVNTMASVSMASSSGNLPNNEAVPEKAHQPKGFSFPKRQFGVKVSLQNARIVFSIYLIN